MRQTPGIPARMTVVDSAGAAAQLSGAQFSAVNGLVAAFRHKVATSIIPNNFETARIPGNGLVQMRSCFGVMTVDVRVPVVTKADKAAIIFEADVYAYVYITGEFNMSHTELSFVRKGGKLSYTLNLLPPFSGGIAAYGVSWYNAAVAYDPYFRYEFIAFDAGKVGVFGGKNRFFLKENEITRDKEILKTLPYGPSYESPRNYDGVGYLAFVVTSTSVIQDDGTKVFTAPGKSEISSVSFHPTAPVVSLIERTFMPESTDYRVFSNAVAKGGAGQTDDSGSGNIVTYRPFLQLTGLLQAQSRRIELVLRNGAWEEVASEDVSNIASPSNVSFNADYQDYYLKTVSKVSGLVQYTKDVPYYTQKYPSSTAYPPGGGTCELDASYKHSSSEDVVAIWYDQSGGKAKVTKGWDKEYRFSGSRKESSPYPGFEPFTLSTSEASVSREWYEFDNARFYTLDSSVEWSTSASVTPSTSANGLVTLAGYGHHTGSARLHVKCQRRVLLAYDPEHKFLCYVEEQKFEYLWEPTASCAMMETGLGSSSSPYEGVPLEGTDGMVPVGEPAYYLVMQLDGKEAHRERLTLNSDFSYTLRVGMIPVMSVFLQPTVAALPPNYISIEDYTEMVRTFLCTGYQFYSRGKLLSPKNAVPKLYENRFYAGPYQEDVRLDDYFLRFGAFLDMPKVDAKYINDSVTRAGVLLVKEDGAFDLPATAYVVSKDTVEKHPVEGAFGLAAS